MSAKNDPEKEQIKLEADKRTQWELQRIISYRELRYNYVRGNSENYYNSIYERNSQSYKPQRNASKRDARKSLHIGLLTSFKTQFDPEEKKEMNNCLEAERIRLQEYIDAANQREYERCDRVNNNLKIKLINQKQALAKRSMVQANEYFFTVIQSDCYSLDGEYRYEVDCSVRYIRPQKRLIIDYRLPTHDELSNTKEWQVNKNKELVEKPFPKGEFLVLYEKIILDLAIRVIGLAFDSDDLKIVSEIVFNGFCLYDNVPDNIVFILTALVTREKFNTSAICRADYSSKTAISKFVEVDYLDDINSDTPPKSLADKPPLKEIKPIQSNLKRL